MSFDPSPQMKQELWDKAGDEAERVLPKKVTDELMLRVEEGQKIAALMEMPGWEIVERILYKELQFGQMVEDSEQNKLDVAQTYRVGIMVGVLKRIYKLPRIAEKAKKLLEEDAKRRAGHGKRRRQDSRGTGEGKAGRTGRPRWIGREGKRETA